MKNRISIAAVAVALTLSVTACKQTEQATTGSEPTATQASTSEVAGTTSPNDLNPVQAQSFIDDVTMGHEVGADGSIPTGKTGDDFAPGQPVHVTMKVNNAPAGSAVKIVYTSGGKTVGEETKPVTAGATYLSFMKDSTGWPKGDYDADIYIGDEKVNTQHFQITDPAGAGK
jgi:hypothetical protein